MSANNSRASLEQHRRQSIRIAQGDEHGCPALIGLKHLSGHAMQVSLHHCKGVVAERQAGVEVVALLVSPLGHIASQEGAQRLEQLLIPTTRRKLSRNLNVHEEFGYDRHAHTHTHHL